MRSALIAHRVPPSPAISLLSILSRILIQLQTQAAEGILVVWLGSFLLQLEAGLPLPLGRGRRALPNSSYELINVTTDFKTCLLLVAALLQGLDAQG